MQQTLMELLMEKKYLLFFLINYQKYIIIRVLIIAKVNLLVVMLIPMEGHQYYPKDLFGQPVQIQMFHY